MRIKLVKDHRLGKKGDVIEVSRNVAFGLTDSGAGIISKDMTPDDYKQAGVKHGKPSKLRTNNSR